MSWSNRLVSLPLLLSLIFLRIINGFITNHNGVKYDNKHFLQAYIDEYHFNSEFFDHPATTTTPDENHKKIYIGGGTVGDIMSSPNSTKTSLLKSGLVTSFPHGTIQSRFGLKVPNGFFQPVERIALTANGNLQRIFSSYYDAPVEVVVESCNMRKIELDGVPAPAIWDRCVHLNIFNQVCLFSKATNPFISYPCMKQKFCTATSEVHVHSSDCITLVQSGKVGIGQLFRYLDRLPTFELLNVGRNQNGGLWREYILECKEVSCKIHEEFIPNAWDLQSMNEN